MSVICQECKEEFDAPEEAMESADIEIDDTIAWEL